MHENDILNVKIEKFSNLGTGIAKVDGQVVFVENSCPEDEVKIKITKVNKNYATAKTLEVIAPSKHRIEPFCPMQKICGACQLQFIDYDYQLKLKKQIVEDAMRTIGHINTPINDPIPSPKIKAYRCKVQYPVAQTKVSERILAGVVLKDFSEGTNSSAAAHYGTSGEGRACRYVEAADADARRRGEGIEGVRQDWLRTG